MIVALEVPSDKDLSLFTRYLRQIGIRHRIHEEGNNQVVMVVSEVDRERVIELYEKLERGEMRLEAVNHPGGRSHGEGIVAYLMRFPLTLALVIINVACYPATMGLNDGQVSAWLHAMTFLEFDVEENTIYFHSMAETLADGQYWRLLTPMFIHFSILHIVFNLLWVWEVGRRIELINGASVLLLVVLVSSLSANVLQYAMTGPGLFGGMSGVVFGLLGFSLIWSRLVPRRSMGLPIGIYVFMFIFLALGFTGAIDLLGMGALANGAHLGGLVAGILIGLVAGLLHAGTAGTGHPRS